MDDSDKKLDYLYCVGETLHYIYLALGKDKEKTSAWFYINNPGLNGKPPIQMIRDGDAPKLLEYIEQALEKRDASCLHLPNDT